MKLCTEKTLRFSQEGLQAQRGLNAVTALLENYPRRYGNLCL